MLFLLNVKWDLLEKEFSYAKIKTNSSTAIKLAEMLKEPDIHLCLFDESHYSNIGSL